MNGPDPGAGADPSPAEDDARALGRLFEDAREAAGFNTEEAARRLYLSPDLVRNIEAGTLEKLPKPAYLRGYLRSYARLVGLSGDEVVARYDAIGRDDTEEEVHLLPVTEEEVGSAKLTGPVTTAGLWGLAGIVLILLLVWGFSGEEERAAPQMVRDTISSPPAPATLVEDSGAVPGADVADTPAGALGGRDPIAAIEPSEGGAREGEASTATVYTGERVSIEIGEEEDEWRALDAEPLLVDEMAATETAVAELDRVGAAVSERAVPGELETAGAGGAEIAVERRLEGDSVYVTIRAGGEDHLNFSFSDDCWIEVSESIGAVLYEDLHHAGDVVDLFGPAPFRVLVGRAQAVAIRFNGKEVELVPNIVNNTAKVELGS